MAVIVLNISVVDIHGNWLSRSWLQGNLNWWFKNVSYLHLHKCDLAKEGGK